MAIAIPDLLVQRVRFSNRGGGPPGTDFRYVLFHPSSTGNTIVFDLGFGVSAGDISTITVTVSDDQGNTYTPRVDTSDVGNGARLIHYSCIGATAGTQKIRIQFSSAVIVTQVWLAEACNISGYRTGHGQTNAGSTSWSPGAFSPTAGDWVHVAALQDFGGSSWSAFTPFTGFALTSSDRRDGFATQDGLAASTGSITPAITGQSTNTIGVGVAYVFSSGTGTPVDTSTWRVLGVQWHHFSGGASFTGTQFPCKGNMIEGSWLGGSSTSAVTDLNANPTDNKSNTYSHSAANDVLSAGAAQHFWCIGATTGSDLTIDLSTNSTDNVSDLVLLDINAPAGAAFRQTANVSGFQSAAGDLALGSYTPAGANSLVLFAGGFNQGTAREETSGTMWRVHPYFIEEDGTTSGLHEDNPWLGKVTTSATALAPTLAVSQPVADWVGQFVEFTAASYQYARPISDDLVGGWTAI